MDTIELLGDLSNAFGVSGFEDEVREVISNKIESHVDEIQTDALGNLIATRKGSSDFKLMLDAHMDEIGLMVNYVDDKGFLRFTNLGGWDPRILPSQTATVLTRDGEKIKGVIGTVPPHISRFEERDKPFRMEDLFIDIGVSSKEEVEKMGIRIGDPAVPAYPFEVLNPPSSPLPDRQAGFNKGGNRGIMVMGKALDDRVGCAVLIKILENLSDKLDFTVVCNFATGEEIGLRGARTAAYQIEPDLALAFEGTIGADVPGIPPQRQPVGLGKGPAITVADRTLVVNRNLVKAIESLAEKENIPFQTKLPAFGGTDAGVIHLTRGGILSGVISVPCRYIHSPFSIMRLEDFENTVKLAHSLVKNCRTLVT
jgi:endoglucanase